MLPPGIILAASIFNDEICPTEAGRSCIDLTFKGSSEPTGANGLAWGTRLSALPDMKRTGAAEIGGSLPQDLWDAEKGKLTGDLNVDIYVKSADSLAFRGVQVDRIEYGFWNGKLSDVRITTKGETAFTSLRSAVFKAFGAVRRNSFFPSSQNRGDEYHWYLWTGKTSEMELSYVPSTEEGQLWLGSTLLKDQIIAEARKHAQQTPSTQTTEQSVRKDAPPR